MLSGGGATSVAYNDSTGVVTISSTDTNTNTQRTDEEIRDVIGAMISGSGATSVTYNDSVIHLPWLLVQPIITQHIVLVMVD